jgi:hypothetical protein
LALDFGLAADLAAVLGFGFRFDLAIS